jgi:hypothetical protein
VPLFSAFTEYSAMLRSGRAATLGREGMPAFGGSVMIQLSCKQVGIHVRCLPQ